MNNSSTFQSLLDELVDISTRQHKKATSFNLYLNNRVQKIFKTLYPKKKYNWKLIKDTPEYLEYKADVEKISQKFWDFWTKKKDKIKEKLYEEAAKLTPPKTNKFILWKSSSSSSYSSQGFGASSYSRNNAESYADKARLYNLEVEIRTKNQRSDNKYGIQHADFEVWVKTNEIGLSILDYGKDLSLVETVRLYLKRGVNPRVSMPFLPMDFEAKNGLDYFGNYIDKAR